MTGEALWNSITKLSSIGEEFQTTNGFWFSAIFNSGKLYIDRATNHTPSVRLTQRRPIIKKDFLYVYSYYERWVNGEPGIRQLVSSKSKNTTYIFAVIKKFKNRVNGLKE